MTLRTKSKLRVISGLSSLLFVVIYLFGGSASFAQGYSVNTLTLLSPERSAGGKASGHREVQFLIPAESVDLPYVWAAIRGLRGPMTPSSGLQWRQFLTHDRKLQITLSEHLAAETSLFSASVVLRELEDNSPNFVAFDSRTKVYQIFMNDPREVRSLYNMMSAVYTQAGFATLGNAEAVSRRVFATSDGRLSIKCELPRNSSHAAPMCLIVMSEGRR